MRLVLRVAVVVLLLAVVAVGVLIWQAPRWVDTPQVRAYLQQVATDQIGRDVRYRELGVGLVPPRIVVSEAEVAGAETEAPALVRADSVGVELALDDLIARRLRVTAVHIEGATLHLVRDEDGIRWPRSEDAGAGDTGEPGADEPRPPPVPPAFEVLHLRDVELVLEDRTARRGAVTWRLLDLGGEATAPAGQTAEFALSGRLESGGDLEAHGHWGADGNVAIDVTLSGFDPQPANAYLAPERAIAGQLSGAVAVTGPANRPDAVRAELALAAGQVTFKDFVLRGPMSLDTDLQGDPLTGRFEFDATAAALDFRDGMFAKPAGTPGHATGRVVRDARGRLAIDDVRVKISNVDASGRLETGERTRFDVSAPTFDIEGFGGLWSALRPRGFRGPVSVPALTLWSKPFEMEGEALLQGVTVPFGEKGTLELHGTLRARDGQLVAEGGEVHIGEQVCRVDFTLLDLRNERPYRLHVRTRDADAAGLARGLTGAPGRLEGPITLDARLHGFDRAGRPTLGTLAGSVALTAGPGRILGISLLRLVFEKIGLIGRTVFRFGGLVGADAIVPFYDDDYESILGDFEVADGVARTDNLVVRRPSHRFDLKGTYNLVDRSIDGTGVLTIGEKLDAVLSRAVGREARPGKIQQIRIAHIGGTVDAPVVEVSKTAAVAFLALYSITGVVDRVGGGIGEVILDGAGRMLGGEKTPDPESP